MNGSVPAAAPTKQRRFVITPEWVLDRLKRQPGLIPTAVNNALRLYFELKAKFIDYRTGIGTPTREAIAAAMAVSLSTMDRTVEILRRIGAVRTRRVHDDLGHITGLEFTVYTAEPADDVAGAVHFVTDDDMAKSSPVTTGQNIKKPSILSPVTNRSHFVTGDEAFLNTYLDQDLDLDDDDHSDHSLRARVCARETRATSSSPDEGKGNDDREGNDGPTDAECAEAFYALWTAREGAGRAPCQRWATDGAHIATIRVCAAFAEIPILDVLAAYFDWPDPYCATRKRPLGLLAANIGSVIAWLASIPVVVEEIVRDDDSPEAIRRRMSAQLSAQTRVRSATRH